MMKLSNKNFAQVFNVFIEPTKETEEQQYKLTPQELYLYAHLSIRKTCFYDVPSVITSVDLLSQMVVLQKKQSANKKAIRAALEALKSKGVINFEASAANSNLLEVMFIDNDVLKTPGFEPVYGDLFTLAETPEQFMVLCVVQRWKSVSGFCTTGFERWMEILECGRGKVNDLLESMQTTGKIVVSSGKNRRSYNRYWVGDGVPVEVVVDADDDIAVIDAIDAVEGVDGVDAVEAIEEVVEVGVDAREDVPAEIDVVEAISDVEAFSAANDHVPPIEDVEPSEQVELVYDPELDDPFDPFQQFEHSPNKAISEGVRLARHLAEQQPPAAKEILYGGQFTDEYKRLPRAVLTDVLVYAEHFKVNPSEDIYVQVDRLRRGYEWGCLELYLEVMERVAT
jgi:hypothetical protein